MAYPKPLSEKTIEKRYKDARLNDKKIIFIRTFFHACANLYGAIALEDVWEIYKTYAKKADCMKIMRKDFLNAAAIMRREVNPFFVYEAEEIYCDVRNRDIYMEIVHLDLVLMGYYKLRQLFELKDNTQPVAFYIPEDFLDYADEKKLVSREEEQLKKFIDQLVVNLNEYEDEFTHKMKPCSGHIGERIADFNWINEDEKFEIQYANGEITGKKGNANKVKQLTEYFDRPVSEKIMEQMRKWTSVGLFAPNQILKYVFDDLEKVGVGLSREEVETFMNLFMQFNNHFHMWRLRGWSPVEL